MDTNDQAIDFLLTAKRDTTASFCQTIRHQGEPEAVTINTSGTNMADDTQRRQTINETITVRQNKYLNNGIEQVHRNIKQRIRRIQEFKSFRRAQANLAGIELVHMIHRGQYQHSENVGLSARNHFIYWLPE